MGERKQYVITRIDNRLVGVYMIGERIYDALIVNDNEDETRVGDVYVGRVKNVVDNINAAFVEFREGVMGFLPISSELKNKIKPEQEIIVQVKKPATGNKDAVLSTDIELVGRYVIWRDKSIRIRENEPESSFSFSVSVSRKIDDVSVVRKLGTAGKRFFTDEFNIDELFDNGVSSGLYVDMVIPGITIRTNAADVSEDVMLDELRFFCEKWRIIRFFGNNRKLYSRLYAEPPAYIRMINRYKSNRPDRIITDCDAVAELVNMSVPDIPVELYTDMSYPLDARYAISTTLNKACDRRVWLKSGANLIIDRTEAMMVIDVNTAKAIDGKRASETTFFKINCEAAEEIARQLRLRNLSGIILVDFIDMKEQGHIDHLIACLRSFLKDDPVRATYIDYTKLGLVEITRAKQAPSLYEHKLYDSVMSEAVRSDRQGE
ncbi:MAG: ribonuclease E/G [Eubacterium sp.]|nr:ribonuclease E/G [Eubacterium sp.]